MAFQEYLEIETSGRGSLNVTSRIQAVVDASGIAVGTCNVFIQHTSASLLLTENADPQVRRDLETFFSKLVPDGDSMFEHDDEGPDDMPAHVRTVLAESSLSVPVTQGHLALGTWQGIYVWEHRASSHSRRLVITVSD